MRTLLFSLLLGTTLIAQGQNGIRFTVLDFEANTGKFKPNLILGYDRDLTDRLSIGADIIRGYVFDREALTSSYYSGSNSYSYDVSRSIWGMQYRSQYFFGGSVYLGSTIGFRQVTMTLDPYGSSSYNSTPTPAMSKTTARTTIVPLGLRFGFRSDLDGWYGDVYLGIGYNAGAGKDLFPNLDLERNTHTMSKAWINIGYAMGLGW